MTRKPGTRVGRIRRAVYVLIASAVLLEVVLQIGAVITALSYERAPLPAATIDRADGELRVLCVGDSFTYGDGASTPEHSYPLVMQRLLAEVHGIAARVTNAGWPGQDSRDVLASLTDQLERTHPDVVCVLVGINDMWNRPEPIGKLEDESGRGFKLRWRTARLFKWFFQQAEGSWRRTGPAGGPPTAAMVSAARDMIARAGLHTSEHPWKASTPKEVRDVEALTWASFRHKRYREAIDRLEAALARREELTLRSLLVCAWARDGNRPRALRELEVLTASCRDDQSPEAETALLSALWNVGETDRAFEYGKQVVERHPQVPDAWNVLALAAFRRDQALAEIAFTKQIECLEKIETWHTTPVSYLGRLLAAKQPDRAAALLQAGLLLGGGLSGVAFSNYLIAAKAGIPSETMSAHGDAPGLDDRGRALLREGLAEVYSEGDSRWRRVLEHHLFAIEALCREKGARTIFVSYPSHTAHESAVVAVAEETGAPFVNVRERFARELETKAREDLFVEDGHCNDAGYAIIAAEVGDAVAGLLGK